jgi:hypothetical protein
MTTEQLEDFVSPRFLFLMHILTVYVRSKAFELSRLLRLLEKSERKVQTWQLERDNSD